MLKKYTVILITRKQLELSSLQPAFQIFFEEQRGVWGEKEQVKSVNVNLFTCIIKLHTASKRVIFSLLACLADKERRKQLLSSHELWLTFVFPGIETDKDSLIRHEP